MNKDNKFPFMDLNKFLDEVFGQVEGFSEKLQTEMERTFHGRGPWTEGLDFYPAYAYPPMNVYLTTEKDLVIEMALAASSRTTLSCSLWGITSSSAPGPRSLMRLKACATSNGG